MDCVLCGSNGYEKKYYLNNDFERLPEEVKAELRIMCVLFTEEIGGIMTMGFDENGTLKIEVYSDEGDLLYDEIGCELKIKELQKKKKDLLEALEMYYKVFALGE